MLKTFQEKCLLASDNYCLLHFSYMVENKIIYLYSQFRFLPIVVTISSKIKIILVTKYTIPKT